MTTTISSPSFAPSTIRRRLPFLPGRRTIPAASILAAISAFLLAAATASEIVEGLSMPYRSVTVSSPLQEVVKEVLVEEGDAVSEGQLLARLIDDEEQIEFKRASKILEKREFDFNASSELAKDKLISQEKALESEAELEIAQLNLDLARTLVEEKAIKSPIRGIVVRKFKEAGEGVDRVEPMFTVEDTTRIYVQFYVTPSTARALKPGTEVPFTMDDEPTVEHAATVDFVSPSADPASGLFRIKLLFDNAEGRVAAGLRARARFAGTTTAATPPVE